MKTPEIVARLLEWFDRRPYRISVTYLILLGLAFVPVCLRVGDFLQSRWNPFPKLTDSQVLVLGDVCDALLLLAALTGIAMCVTPLVPLLFGRFRTAAKMVVGMVLALFLTVVVMFCMGPFLYCFGGETRGIRANSQSQEVN